MTWDSLLKYLNGKKVVIQKFSPKDQYISGLKLCHLAILDFGPGVGLPRKNTDNKFQIEFEKISSRMLKII